LALGSSGLSLALGNLYELVFPEDPYLLHGWHNAGAYVHMTIRLINAYFCRIECISILGKIDSDFPLVSIRDIASESGTSLETRDTEVRDESIGNLDTGDDELMATLNGKNELEVGDSTGDGRSLVCHASIKIVSGIQITYLRNTDFCVLVGYISNLVLRETWGLTMADRTVISGHLRVPHRHLGVMVWPRKFLFKQLPLSIRFFRKALTSKYSRGWWNNPVAIRSCKCNLAYSLVFHIWQEPGIIVKILYDCCVRGV
jgi:hypothetical protein